MTKKDYIKIAELIRKYTNDNKPLIMGFAEVLQEDNPRFDKGLFLDACNLENDKKEKVIWYICDYADKCSNMGCCDGRFPLSNKKEWFNKELLKPNKCGFNKQIVKLIPIEGKPC